MKIAVYSIAKNEAPFALRWADTAAQADYRVVLDTGSTDDTVQLLRGRGVEVHSAHISPWRFDEARTQALALVPADADVCIALDMDEVLRPGWREALELAWTPTTTLLRHPLYPEWSDEQGQPVNYFSYVGRVHARHLYEWHYAIHEVLRPLGRHQETFTDRFVIDHRTDKTRSKDIYKDMLRTLVEQEPLEPRYSFYNGIEFFNRGEYAQALSEFERFLQLGGALSGSERGFVHRLVARVHRVLDHHPALRLESLRKATLEAHDERESWMELADAYADAENWPQCLAACINALRATDQRRSFHIDLETWRGKPERLLAHSAQRAGMSADMLEKLKENIPPTRVIL